MNVLLLLPVLALIAAAFWRARCRSAPARRTRRPAGRPRELAERDAFIEQLRETAWQHRDVSPELSTIIIDEITTHHRRLSSGPDA